MKLINTIFTAHRCVIHTATKVEAPLSFSKQGIMNFGLPLERVPLSDEI